MIKKVKIGDLVIRTLHELYGVEKNTIGIVYEVYESYCRVFRIRAGHPLTDGYWEYDKCKKIS